MKKTIITIFIAFITLATFAQNENAFYQIQLKKFELEDKYVAFGLSEYEFNAIKDDAYANSKFIAGNIFQDDKIAKSYVPMRYNAYADEIEIKNSDSEDDYGSLLKDPSIYVKIFQDIYVFIPLEGSNEKGGYFNILSDGKYYDLYKKVTSTFNKAVIAKTSYDRDIPASFTKTTTYYLVLNGRFFELPDSKSKVLKVMDEKKDEVKSFMKENDLDLGKESDLIKLVSYFDSLL